MSYLPANEQSAEAQCPLAQRNVARLGDQYNPADTVTGIGNTEDTNRSGMVCAGCKALELKVTNLQETVENLKDALSSFMSSQNFDVMTSPVDSASRNIKSNFPAEGVGDLARIDAQLDPNNREMFISTIKGLLQNSLRKNIEKVLSSELIMDYNIDGTHGKKGLKDHKKFYSVLMESIKNPTSNVEPEVQLRRVLQLQKKRVFQRRSGMAKAIKTEQFGGW